MNDVVLGAVANVHTALLQAGLAPADSGPVAPPGVATKTDTLIGWAKWVCFAICIFGLIFVAAKLAANNRRGESETTPSRLVRSWLPQSWPALLVD